MEGVVILKKKRYVAPSMGALRGRTGRLTLEIIRNTPAPDRTEMRKRADAAKRLIMAERENGR